MSTPRTRTDRPLNVSYLVVGLIFLGIAGSWALHASGVVDTGDVQWLIPLVLVGAGLIGLVAFTAKGLTRGRGDERYDDEGYDDEGYDDMRDDEQELDLYRGEPYATGHVDPSDQTGGIDETAETDPTSETDPTGETDQQDHTTRIEGEEK